MPKVTKSEIDKGTVSYSILLDAEDRERLEKVVRERPGIPEDAKDTNAAIIREMIRNWGELIEELNRLRNENRDFKEAEELEMRLKIVKSRNTATYLEG